MALVLAGGCAWWAAPAFLLALSRDPRPAIGARMLLDLADAVRYARGRPEVATITLGFAALGAVAPASRSRRA
jgi:hypothetical protein